MNCWSHAECDWRAVLKAFGVSEVSDGSGPWVRCGENGCKSDTNSRVALYDHSDGGKTLRPQKQVYGTHLHLPPMHGRPGQAYMGPGKASRHTPTPMGAQTSPKMFSSSSRENLRQRRWSHMALTKPALPLSRGEGGAGKEKDAAWDRAKGRSVILWPDLDSEEQGLRAMEAAARKADAAGATSLYMVELAEMPNIGKDGADAADVDSDTALSLLPNAPPYEPPGPATASTIEREEQFGPQADMEFDSPRALSATANAIRLLMLCPEDVMVALNEEGEATLRVCESATGLWRRSAVAKGVVIEQSMERWERYLLHPDHSPALGSTQKARLKTWIGRSRSPLGHKAIEDSLSTALGVLESYEEMGDLKKRGLLVCSEIRCRRAEGVHRCVQRSDKPRRRHPPNGGGGQVKAD